MYLLSTQSNISARCVAFVYRSFVSFIATTDIDVNRAVKQNWQKWWMRSWDSWLTTLQTAWKWGIHIAERKQILTPSRDYRHDRSVGQTDTGDVHALAPDYMWANNRLLRHSDDKTASQHYRQTTLGRQSGQLTICLCTDSDSSQLTSAKNQTQSLNYMHTVHAESQWINNTVAAFGI